MAHAFDVDPVEKFPARPLPVTWLDLPVRIMRVSCDDARGDPPPGQAEAHRTGIRSDPGVLGRVVDTQDENPG